MTKYAASTSVSSDRSRAEIERTLQRYSATSFAYGWQDDRAVVGFTLNDRQIRFILPMPDRKSHEFTRSDTGRARTSTAATAAYEQAVRQRWRALALVIKAKLEAVESGIVTFDDEFAMHMVLPDGSRAGDAVVRAINTAYATGTVAPMLAIGAGS